MTDPGLGLLVAGGLFEGAAWFAILTFVPLFAVRALEATAFAAGLAISMRGVARIVVAPFAGQVLTVISRKLATIGSLVVAGVGTVAVAASPAVPWLWLFVGVFGLGDALFTPIHRDAPTDLASSERRAGVVNGVIVLRAVGATVSPVAFGLLRTTTGFEAVFLVAGAM